MYLLRFDQVGLEFGDQVILRNADFSLAPQERVCLIGRNGAGKSSLLKLISHQLEPDHGEIIRRNMLQISELKQTLPNQLNLSVTEFVLSGLQEQKERIQQYQSLSKQQLNKSELHTLQELQQQIETHGGWNIEQQAQAMISEMQLPPEYRLSELSGGWQRRVALAKALVSKPDLLLLDEPTNHLDIHTIQWLEQRVRNYPGCVLFITHDRAFLQALATRIVEIDRGVITSWPGDYQKYLDQKQQSRESEKKHNQLFDRKLEQEEAWIRQGIKARRTRNEGRVRALHTMREERAARIDPEAEARIAIAYAEPTGKTVISAKNLGFSFDHKNIVDKLTLKIRRGDRIGLVGNNGVGKSTLLKLLLGELSAHSGTIKMGTNLQVGYFDQSRHPLDPEKTVAEVIGDGSEYITLNGKQRHVVGYLKGFLFSAKRALTPLKVLSGGERNRVILARIFSRPTNVLILDEPTNDLDVETLEVLEEQLQTYEGTLIVVSHDRKFLDKTVTSLLVFEHGGALEFYQGSFSDWLSRGKKLAVLDRPDENTNTQSSGSINTVKKNTSSKLSYKYRIELEQLPDKIEKIELQLQSLQTQINSNGFYDQSFEETEQVLTALRSAETELDAAMQRWAELEEMQANYQRR